MHANERRQTLCVCHKKIITMRAFYLFYVFQYSSGYGYINGVYMVAVAFVCYFYFRILKPLWCPQTFFWSFFFSATPNIQPK